MVKLHYPKERELPWRRVKRGSGFAFITKSAKGVSEKAKERILSLKIPPAWKDVRISSDPFSHIQAVGIDARGRKQYIYHKELVKHNQEHKFDQMVAFGESLPTLREVVRDHMRERMLTRNRILATVVWLLENTFIRVGNKTYAEDNKSYGLTTLRNKHVDVEGSTVTFSFKGKSGVFHEMDVSHPRVAATVRACIALPGYQLFQYLNGDGERQIVDSADVNDYLKDHAGSDFSAKDFRTWGGSVLAGESLYEKGGAETDQDLKNHISETVDKVSTHLGNTKKVCRTYYIHPVIIKSYKDGVLVPHFDRAYKRTYSKKFRLTPEEYATWSLIKDF